MRTMADAESLRDAAPRTPRPRRHPRSAQEVRDRRRRILTWLLSAGLAVLLVNSIVGENGYLATVQSEHEQRRLEAELARTREANAATLNETVTGNRQRQPYYWETNGEGTPPPATTHAYDDD